MEKGFENWTQNCQQTVFDGDMDEGFKNRTNHLISLNWSSCLRMFRQLLDLHQCLQNQVDKMLLSQHQLHFVPICSFFHRFKIILSYYCFQGNFFLASWNSSHKKTLLNLDLRSPLALKSHLASSSVVVHGSGRKWGTITTSWLISFYKFARESRSYLCLMLVYSSFGQWRA